MEKLRAYIATIREKFHPTLTPEASELLENHYSLCRQQRNGESLITVRFLESLIRLSQAHARLMYRDKVLLDDAVAAILLMECTPAASSGGMFGGGGGGSYSYDMQFSDTTLQKNPIDTEFRPFDEADALFEKEKQTLLERYRGVDCQGSNNGMMAQQFKSGVSPPPFRSNLRDWEDYKQRGGPHSQPPHAQNGQGGRNDLRDQWGRQMLSQQGASPHPQNHSIRQAIEAIDPNQYTPATSHGGGSQHSENRVTFSQPLDDLDDGYSNGGRDAQVPQQQQRQQQQLGAFAPGFQLPEEHDARYGEHSGQGGGQNSMSQHSGSGKRRKKRRTAD